MGSARTGLPFSSPDVITAYCLYDLSEQNVAIRSPLPEGPWSLSVSSRPGDNFYVVTGADAKKLEARVLLIRRDRLSEELATEKTAEGDDQNIVVSPSETGIVVIRAPLRGESFRAQTMIELQKARCNVQPSEPVIASVGEPDADLKNNAAEMQMRARWRKAH